MPIFTCLKAKEDPHVILGEMKVLQTAHNKLVGKFKSVQTQNEELWNEVAEHRRRHAQQQWKIDRIMKCVGFSIECLLARCHC